MTARRRRQSTYEVTYENGAVIRLTEREARLRFGPAEWTEIKAGYFADLRVEDITPNTRPSAA